MSLGYDRIFKELAKKFFGDISRKVITDYELIKFPKKTDVLVIEIESGKRDNLDLFSYMTKWN